MKTKKTKKKSSRNSPSKKATVLFSAKKRKKRNHFFSYVGIFLLFVFAIFFAFSLQKKSPLSQTSTQLHTKAYAENNVYSSIIASASAIENASPSPTTTPIPTVTPTTPPTPSVILNEGVSTGTSTDGSGFCLYVPVLYYHHIEPMDLATQEGHASLTVDSTWFDQQLAYLTSNGYNSISLQQLVSAIQNHQSLPAKSFAVTLDDGYSDAFTYAYPIFQKYHVKGDLFIPAGLINNPGYLTWDQLKQMQSSGLISINNHTWSHYPLGQGDTTKINFEMNTSQQEFKNYLGITPTIMAYPYGSYSPLAIQLLQQEGFTSAFSTISGQDECSSNLMEAPRVRIGNAPMATYGF